MATSQLTASSISARSLLFPSFEGGLKPSSTVRVSSLPNFRQPGGLSLRSFRGLTVKAATVVAPKVLLIFSLLSSYLFDDSVICVVCFN